MKQASVQRSPDAPTEGPNAPAKPTSWSFALGFTLSALVAGAIVSLYWVPLFLGAALAVTLAPLHRGLGRLLGGRGSLAAALVALLVLLVVLAPLASLVAYGANEMAQGVGWLKETMQPENLRALVGGQIPAPLRPVLQRALSGFQVDVDDLTQYGQRGVELAQQLTPKVAGASLSMLGNMLLLLLALFFFLTDGPALIALILRVSPLRGRHTRELIDEFRAVASASLMGMAFTGVGQCVVLTLGFAVAGVPRLFFFAVMALISAFVPLVGSMLTWLPVVVGFAVTGQGLTALALAGWSIFSTNVVDGGLKPMVLKGRMAMHGGLLFLGILGGLGLFGAVGVVAGPLCIAFFTTFLTIYQRDYLQKLPLASK